MLWFFLVVYGFPEGFSDFGVNCGSSLSIVLAIFFAQDGWLMDFIIFQEITILPRGIGF